MDQEEREVKQGSNVKKENRSFWFSPWGARRLWELLAVQSVAHGPGAPSPGAVTAAEIQTLTAAQLGFPSGSAVKNSPAVQEPQEMGVRSPGWEDPLEEGMTIPSSIRAWRLHGQEDPGELQSIGWQRVGHA